MKSLFGYDVDDIIDLVGLQRRRSTLGMVLPAVGLFALGAGIGAAAGLMLAPSSGRLLRREMGNRFETVRDRVSSRVRSVASEANNAVSNSAHSS
ncbi:MAG: YtxH domain-containing protein [Myxococcales bacterium]|nr:YtxH domain-containing protein [Myxococcales bacterium]